MATTTRTTALQEIREKVVAGERLDLDDGITLLESHDILELGELADLARRLEPVQRCRKVGKRDMVLNDALPKIEVDPETYTVKADGRLLTCEPAKVLPMAQRYFLF